ncbi:MAG: rhomboid family intramembrane serine protease [Candidatus Aenigmarchaeota archaeon]|nr:rhomboid family intramembrane serine protease [Candidatus Aenigmarchaeota archaeon]
MRPVFYIVAANVVMFLLQLIIPGFTELFALTPALATGGMFWQFLTYMFLHGSFFHIAINMFVLLIFAPRVEEIVGRTRFLILYFASGIVSGMFYLLLTGTGSQILMLGASGAVYAVVAAFAILYPKEVIVVYFMPLPAAVVLVLLVLMESVFGLFGLQAGVANWGHLGGLIAGAALMLYWKKKKIAERKQILEYVVQI